LVPTRYAGQRVRPAHGKHESVLWYPLPYELLGASLSIDLDPAEARKQERGDVASHEEEITQHLDREHA
jgi:hypothetical protein